MNRLTLENIDQVSYGDTIFYNDTCGIATWDCNNVGNLMVNGLSIRGIVENYDKVYWMERFE